MDPTIIADVKIVGKDRQAIFIQPKELACKFTDKRTTRRTNRGKSDAGLHLHAQYMHIHMYVSYLYIYVYACMCTHA